MAWGNLVQRLWNVAESQGFSAFEDRISAVLPDIKLGALLDGLRCIFRAGKSDIAVALLHDFLSSHVSCKYIKQKLYFFALFDSMNNSGSYDSGIDLLDELRRLIGVGSLDRVILRLVDEIELSNNADTDLVELLGHVCMLKYSGNKKSVPVVQRDGGLFVREEFEGFQANLASLVEPEKGMFVWSEQPDIILEHDEGCVKSAALLQASMSAGEPIKTDAYDWNTHLESSRLEGGEDFIRSLNSVGEGDDVSLSEDGVSLDLDLLEARFSYFESRYIKLQVQEKEMLGFVLSNSKSNLAELAKEFGLTEPVVSYMVGTKLRFWLDRDKRGVFSIKHGLIEFLPKNAFGEKSEKILDEDVGDYLLISTDQGVSADKLISRLDLLPENARKVLVYFTENAGQKTHVAASALSMSHLVMLSLLNGCLDDYLERDRAFVVTPRSGVTELLVKAGMSEAVWIGI